MISCPGIVKRDIRLHYDWSTAFYRLLWGPHIHHGLWEADESPAEAQTNLIRRAAELAGVRRGDAVVDVGCGMGGSSAYLAKHYDCRVTGITLSPVQRAWAVCGSTLRGVGGRTKFLRADAEQIDFPPASFDVVWSIECTEHLFDKPAFFRKAAKWLKPGGRMMICAWLAGDEPLDDAQRQQVYDVCEGFLCPSLATAADYRGWMEEAGLAFAGFDDWTDRVTETWEICRRRTTGGLLHRLASTVDRNLALFLDRFTTILNAYRTGAMRYGCLRAVQRDALSESAQSAPARMNGP